MRQTSGDQPHIAGVSKTLSIDPGFNLSFTTTEKQSL